MAQQAKAQRRSLARLDVLSRHLHHQSTPLPTGALRASTVASAGDAVAIIAGTFLASRLLKEREGEADDGEGAGHKVLDLRDPPIASDATGVSPVCGQFRKTTTLSRYLDAGLRTSARSLKMARRGRDPLGNVVKLLEDT